MAKGFTVLVVDDDVVSRTVVQMHLQKAGFNVVTAANGHNALDLFDRQYFPIVLTDWMMPGIDGAQLCQLIREKKTDGYVFIILVTSRDSKTDIVSGLEAGADDYLTKPVHPAEMVARVNTGIRILNLEQSLKKANEEIRLLSITDSLTGCFNRGYLNEHFLHEVKRAQRYEHPLSIVLADVDHFKQVNDTYGHQFGDEVLKIFAHCLQKEIRKKIDWMVRYGGEEFLIVLPETNKPGAFSMAERLRRTVAETDVKAGGNELKITASFGGACFIFRDKNATDITLDQFIREADDQLYRSKKEGRNRINVIEFSPAQ